MPLTIEYNNPDYPAGTQFDLGGILVTNGQATEVDEDSETRFVQRRRESVRDALQSNQFAKVSGDALLPPKKVSELFPATEPATPVVVSNEEDTAEKEDDK